MYLSRLFYASSASSSDDDTMSELNSQNPTQGTSIRQSTIRAHAPLLALTQGKFQQDSSSSSPSSRSSAENVVTTSGIRRKTTPRLVPPHRLASDHKSSLHSSQRRTGHGIVSSVIQPDGYQLVTAYSRPKRPLRPPDRFSDCTDHTAASLPAKSGSNTGYITKSVKNGKKLKSSSIGIGVSSSVQVSQLRAHEHLTSRGGLPANVIARQGQDDVPTSSIGVPGADSGHEAKGVYPNGSPVMVACVAADINSTNQKRCNLDSARPSLIPGDFQSLHSAIARPPACPSTSEFLDRAVMKDINVRKDVEATLGRYKQSLLRTSDGSPPSGLIVADDASLSGKLVPDRSSQPEHALFHGQRSTFVRTRDVAPRLFDKNLNSEILHSDSDAPSHNASAVRPPHISSRKVALGVNTRAELECETSSDDFRGREMVGRKLHHSLEPRSDANRTVINNAKILKRQFQSNLSPIVHRSSRADLGSDSDLEHSSINSVNPTSVNAESSYSVQDFERNYIRAWCQAHKICNFTHHDPIIDGNDDEYCRLVEFYLFDKLQLGKGLRALGLLYRWRAYKDRGYYPERYFGSLDPIMYRDRYSRPWQIGERAWTKQERAFGRSYSPTSNAKRSAQHPSPPDPPTSRASASSRHVLRANNINLGAALGSNERFHNNSGSSRAIDDVSSTSSSSNSVSSVESNIKFKAQNARLKEGRPKHRSNNVADNNSTNRISNKANQNEDRSAAQDTLVVGKQRRAKESPYAFEKDPTHARSDSYRSNDDNFAQQNAETTFNSRQNDPNSSFLNRTQSSSVLFMAPGFHHPTKNTCTAFPRLCSASATQTWMSKYRFYRAGLGHNSVGLQHPMAFIQQKEQSWLSDMWNESRSQLNIAHSWSSATLYDDEEFFVLLLKVIVTHVGDDRLIFSSKCSVQCGFDENNQAAVEEYFSD